MSDLGHGALDLVGLIPVVGEVADGVNAGWYAAEGDYVNAALSAAAMVPFVGWAATGGRFAVRGYRAVRSVDGARTWLNGRPPMVPRDAERLPFTNPKFSGENYRWTDPATGRTVRYHAHGPDPDRLPTENAGAGSVYRVRTGRHWLGADGNHYRLNSVDPNSAAYDPHAANVTHIPYPRDLPPPGPGHVRVAVPNVVALGDPLGDDG